MKDTADEFVVVLRPLPGVNATRALRGALKALLRYHQLRAISVRQIDRGDVAAPVQIDPAVDRPANVLPPTECPKLVADPAP